MTLKLKMKVKIKNCLDKDLNAELVLAPEVVWRITRTVPLVTPIRTFEDVVAPEQSRPNIRMNSYDE